MVTLLAALLLQVPSPPPPSGPYHVGTASAFTSSRDRALAVQLFYPSAQSSGSPAPYLPAALSSAMKGEKYMNLGPEILESWRRLRLFSAAARKPATGKFPLVLFSAGAGVSSANYQLMLEDWASHGYVVASIDHPGAGFAILKSGKLSLLNKEDPSRKVEKMAADHAAVKDWLLRQPIAKYIDVRRIAVAGHSLGGAATLESARVHPWVRAAVDLDGDVWGAVEKNGTRKPFLVMLNVPAAPVQIPERMRQERDDSWRAVIRKSPDVSAVIVKVQNTGHFSFSDFPFTVPSDLMSKRGANLPAQETRAVITTTITTFLQDIFEGRSQLPRRLTSHKAASVWKYLLH